MTAALLSAGLPGALLETGFFAWLRRAGYSRSVAAALSALVMVEAGVATAILTPGHSLWLAVGVAGIASSAAAFAEGENARRVILFGGSLAAVQLCDPLGGLVAACMLPAALAMGRGNRRPRDAAGLSALLLFAPVLTGAVLFYLSWIWRLDPLALLAGGDHLIPHAGLTLRLARAAAPVAVAAPALFMVRNTAQGRAVLSVAGAALIAALFATARGMIREPVTLLAAAAPLTAAAIAALPPSDRRGGTALTMTCLCGGLSWAALAMLGG